MNRKGTVHVVERVSAENQAAEQLAAVGAFDALTVDQHRSSISLAVSQCAPPLDTDWHAVAVRVEHGLRTGKIKTRRPDAALKFVLKSHDGVPRIGQPSAALFGDRPLTALQATQRRDEIRLRRMRGDAA